MHAFERPKATDTTRRVGFGDHPVADTVGDLIARRIGGPVAGISGVDNNRGFIGAIWADKSNFYLSNRGFSILYGQVKPGADSPTMPRRCGHGNDMPENSGGVLSTEMAVELFATETLLREATFSP